MSRVKIVSPQPWKLEVPRPLDLEEEFNPTEDITQEFFITEPDDYMFDCEPTARHEIVPPPLWCIGCSKPLENGKSCKRCNP